jgi:predicted CopG family antitoxin
MSRRTTVILDEDVYRRLVDESLRRHGTTKAISKVINEMLKKAFKYKGEILDILLSEKVAETSVKEFESFRRGLSGRFES